MMNLKNVFIFICFLSCGLFYSSEDSVHSQIYSIYTYDFGTGRRVSLVYFLSSELIDYIYLITLLYFPFYRIWWYFSSSIIPYNEFTFVFRIIVKEIKRYIWTYFTFVRTYIISFNRNLCFKSFKVSSKRVSNHIVWLFFIFYMKGSDSWYSTVQYTEINYFADLYSLNYLNFIVSSISFRLRYILFKLIDIIISFLRYLVH